MTSTRRGGWRVVGAALVWAAAACGTDAQADGADAEAFARIINVETSVVAPETFVERIRLTGVVEAWRDVVVSSEESGTVTELVVAKGRRVAAGDPIVRLDGRILQSQVEEARARASLARETWERRKRLWEEDRVGSELAYLEARFAAEQAEAALATLERRLERTVIQAPIEGVLDDRLVEVGALVSPGTPIARIVDLNPVKIVAGVPERYAAEVRSGAQAGISLDVLPEQALEGSVGFVGATVDPQSRTFPIEIVLGNPGGVVKPEMVANVSVVRRTLEDAVVVPQDAVIRDADGYAVFVVDGEGDQARASLRPVRVGASQSNRVVIEEGLAPGEHLITVGQQQVADGDRVRVIGEGER